MVKDCTILQTNIKSEMAEMNFPRFLYKKGKTHQAEYKNSKMGFSVGSK